jgi:RNA polymerase sigma-70 factor, ECF subfamily
MVELINKYGSTLKRYALSLTKGNRADAEDLYQDTLEKILIKKDMYVEEGKFPQWSQRLMRNIFIDKCRKDKRRSPFLEEFSHVLKEQMQVENEADSKLVIEAVSDCIADLKEDQKQIIMLRLEGYKFKEIEDMLKMPSVTLRSIYFKAIKKLRVEVTKRLLS